MDNSFAKNMTGEDKESIASNQDAMLGELGQAGDSSHLGVAFSKLLSNSKIDQKNKTDVIQKTTKQMGVDKLKKTISMLSDEQKKMVVSNVVSQYKQTDPTYKAISNDKFLKSYL